LGSARDVFHCALARERARRPPAPAAWSYRRSAAVGLDPSGITRVQLASAVRGRPTRDTTRIRGTGPRWRRTARASASRTRFDNLALGDAASLSTRTFALAQARRRRPRRTCRFQVSRLPPPLRSRSARSVEKQVDHSGGSIELRIYEGSVLRVRSARSWSVDPPRPWLLSSGSTFAWSRDGSRASRPDGSARFARRGWSDLLASCSPERGATDVEARFASPVLRDDYLATSRSRQTRAQ